MTYNNLKELEGNILNSNDFVYFNIDGKRYKYTVCNDHLDNCNYINNAIIFSILKLDKEFFCGTHYGYYAYGGSWPSCKPADFAALTRVVKALYLEIEKRKEKVVYVKNKNLLPELKVKLSDMLANPLLTTPLIEDEKNISSIISIKRKSRVKRIIGEEQIKLNNY